MDTLPAWLQKLGLERYAKVFAEHEVDLDALRLLNEQDLQGLGLPLGPRRKLLKALAELSRLASPPPLSPVSPASTQAPFTERASAVTPPEGERRQLTVLFCDMVGFTDLASRVDPEVLQGIVRSYEDACAVCITRFEGYVFQRLGDGIVAFFGYPLAHEGEAERAIRAGLEIIEALSQLVVPDVGQLAVRIGIATGLVVVSSAEKGAVGETMNLASRLQAIARPGGIVVSERVSRLASGAFDYEDLGEQTLKGIARPTHAYRILGVSAAASRFEAATREKLTALVGREQEIGLLLDRWQLVQDGEGQVVLLSGEPGIGKSRILSALTERLKAQGATALGFQCSPYYTNTAFYPSIDSLERALRFSRDEAPSARLDKLEALIVTHFGCSRADVRFIATILSIPCEERYGPLSMSPQKYKDETLRALVDLTEAAARRQPTVMLFEDAHWADPSSLEVLDLLIDRVKRFPLLIVLTHRPEFQPRWSAHGHVAALNLSKLTRAQSRAMISTLTGGKPLPSNLLEEILAKTDGVPLFVEELTKSVLESGDIQDAGERYDYVGAAHAISVPATLRDSLMARLERFMPVKEIAQIGAAIGREFSYELIARVAPMPQAVLDVALDQLTESGLAFRRRTPPDAVYTFKHGLVQDTAYDSLLKSHRQQLHAKIAQVIEEHFPDVLTTEPELLAHHCVQANRIQDAVVYCLRAGERAKARSAYPEAQAQFNQALALVRALPSSATNIHLEIDLLTALGPVLMATEGQGSPSVTTLYERARDLCNQIGEQKKLFAITFNFWTTKFLCGDLPAGRQLSEELLANAIAQADPGLVLQAQHTAWATNTWCGNLRVALHAAEEGCRIYDPVRDQHHKFLYGGHDPKCCASAFRGLLLWLLGFPDSAARAREEAQHHMQQLAHPFTSALIGSVGLMTTCSCEGDREPVERIAKQVMEVSMREGYPVTLAWSKACIGWVQALQGKRDGLELIDAATDRLQQMRMLTQLPFYLGLSADAQWSLGLGSKALDTLDRALALAAANDEHWWDCELYRAKGEVLRSMEGATGDAAEEWFLAALRSSRQCEAKSLELRAAHSLARLYQSHGKRRQAYDVLAPIYGWFTEGFETKGLTQARTLLAELA